RQVPVYGSTFTLGVNLAVGNVLGTSTPELVVAPERGGAPFVNVFDLTGNFLKQIQVYGSTFTLGVRVTTGDVAGDTHQEILVAPEAGGAPFVNAFDASTGTLVHQY